MAALLKKIKDNFAGGGVSWVRTHFRLSIFLLFLSLPSLSLS